MTLASYLCISRISCAKICVIHVSLRLFSSMTLRPPSLNTSPSRKPLLFTPHAHQPAPPDHHRFGLMPDIYCPIEGCSGVFTGDRSPDSYREHLFAKRFHDDHRKLYEQNHGTVKPPYKCQRCGREFTRRGTFKRHMDDCGYFFNSRARLLANRSLDDTEKITCNCGSSFKNIRNWEEHIKKRRCRLGLAAGGFKREEPGGGESSSSRGDGSAANGSTFFETVLRKDEN